MMPRAWDVAGRYGITVAERKRLYLYQGRRCAVCRGMFRESELQVNHDHYCGCSVETGRSNRCCVRGLVCAWCNKVLAMADDRPGLLLRAAKYLLRRKIRLFW